MKNNLKKPTRIAGFTLTEIMVAITISSLLMIGVIQIFISSKRGYRVSDAHARVQENMRYALFLLTRELRMAGYTGCMGTSLTNTLNSSTDPFDQVKSSVFGYEGGVSTFPSDFSADVAANTDAIIIYRGGSDRSIKFDQKTNAANFKVNTVDHGMQSGDIILLTDCIHTAVTQITGANSGSNVTIGHNTGGGTVPGNCTKGLGSSDCSSTNGVSYNWGKDAHVMSYYVTAFFVGPSIADASINSIYRLQRGGAKEEIVEGIENMQIVYGEDIDGDGKAERYVKANNANFDNVVSVRIGLLFSSTTEAKNASTSKTFQLADTSVNTGPDKRLRFSYNTTVKMRNIGLR